VQARRVHGGVCVLLHGRRKAVSAAQHDGMQQLQL
jgi:hypothetical protein